MRTVKVPFESPDLDGGVLLGSEGSYKKRRMMLQEIQRHALQQTDLNQIGDIVKETFWPKIMIKTRGYSGVQHEHHEHYFVF